MAPKEKADELLCKFINQWFAFGDYLSLAKAKQCALISVDEIIDSNPKDNPMTHDIDSTEYWYQVKQEIEKL